MDMKRICMVLLAALSLAACNKALTQKNIEGTWSEAYDPTVFAMDGAVRFTFDGNGHYQLRVYDALSSESRELSGAYAIDMIDKNTITINPMMSDFTNVTYTIVKLTSNEMAWQKVGTAPNPGVWASDYRHFVRVK